MENRPSFVMGKKPTQPTAVAQAPVPEPTPPATPASPEVVQAGQDFRQAQMLKKSVKSTIKAGDTGGYNAKPMGKVSPAGGNPMAPPQGKF